MIILITDSFVLMPGAQRYSSTRAIYFSTSGCTVQPRRKIWKNVPFQTVPLYSIEDGYHIIENYFIPNQINNNIIKKTFILKSY